MVAILRPPNVARRRALTVSLIFLCLSLLILAFAGPAQGDTLGWSVTGALAQARSGHTATLLPNGKVLVAGGGAGSSYLTTAELYNPATGTWSATANSLTWARAYHTATLLPNGKVLVAGGIGLGGAQNSAELYDPGTNSWTTAGTLTNARYAHAATLLPNGKVLVAGGSAVGVLSSAELYTYDPAGGAGAWGSAGDMSTGRSLPTATLLPNGKVLVAGGEGTGSVPLNSADLYDPENATTPWGTGGTMTAYRTAHTATMLPNGKVLVAGGQDSSHTPQLTAELFDPNAPIESAWNATNSMTTRRYDHTATLLPNGQVLVAGGYYSGYLTSAEIYDPGAGTWSSGGNMATGRYWHSATLLGNGKVLVAGGYSSGSPGYTRTAELYTPMVWKPVAAPMNEARYRFTATVLGDGRVVVAGGFTSIGGYHYLSSAEFYDPATGTWSAKSLSAARDEHTATRLADGRVMLAGGYAGYTLNTTDFYDPGIDSWVAGYTMVYSRYRHTATLLPNGKVLVAGGYNTSGMGRLAYCELFDPSGSYYGSWGSGGTMSTARMDHTATLLGNGKVLVAGGEGTPSPASAELYDYTTNGWTTVGAGTPSVTRAYHTATLLPNGKVLVAGGYGYSGSYLASTELYDPSTGTWTGAGTLATARAYHTATLLPNGQVVLAGGMGPPGPLNSTEIYDPATGTWMAGRGLLAACYQHTAARLGNGKVLLAGGIGAGYVVSKIAQIYPPPVALSFNWLLLLAD